MNVPSVAGASRASYAGSPAIDYRRRRSASPGGTIGIAWCPPTPISSKKKTPTQDAFDYTHQVSNYCQCDKKNDEAKRHARSTSPSNRQRWNLSFSRASLWQPTCGNQTATEIKILNQQHFRGLVRSTRKSEINSSTAATNDNRQVFADDAPPLSTRNDGKIHCRRGRGWTEPKPDVKKPELDGCQT